MDKNLIRVLLIDDDRTQYLLLDKLIQKAKHWRFELQWVGTYDEAMKAILSNSYDVYLVDYHMEDVSGIEIIRQAVDQGCEIPMIILTGTDNWEVDREAMEAGAVDYLLKTQINPRLLERSIRYAMDRKKIEQQLHHANEQMKHDLILAKNLQQNILSDIPSLPFLKTVTKYLPYDLVSGDIYYMSLNREGSLNIFLGDVVGHGVAAGLMTTMIKMALESIPPNLPTDEIIKKLNTMLFSQYIHKFVSGIFLRIDAKGRLAIANAGHPPVVVVPANGSECIELKQRGIVLGLFDDHHNQYREEQYQLQSGDKFFVFTDGAYEVFDSQNKLYGIEGIMNFLFNTSNRNLKDIIPLWLKAIDQFTGGKPLEDDLTILGFQYQNDSKKIS